jgi:hypothetical protein
MRVWLFKTHSYSLILHQTRFLLVLVSFKFCLSYFQSNALKAQLSNL